MQLEWFGTMHSKLKNSNLNSTRCNPFYEAAIKNSQKSVYSKFMFKLMAIQDSTQASSVRCMSKLEVFALLESSSSLEM